MVNEAQYPGGSPSNTSVECSTISPESPDSDRPTAQCQAADIRPSAAPHPVAGSGQRARPGSGNSRCDYAPGALDVPLLAHRATTSS